MLRLFYGTYRREGMLLTHWLALFCRAQALEFVQIVVAVSCWLSACPRCRDGGFEAPAGCLQCEKLACDFDSLRPQRTYNQLNLVFADASGMSSRAGRVGPVLSWTLALCSSPLLFRTGAMSGKLLVQAGC